jgi:hypothetical protein
MKTGMPTLTELWDALKDTSRATTWWGDLAHLLVLVWVVLGLASVGVPALATFLAYCVLVSWPFAVVRHRRWSRLGRKDPALPLGLLVGFTVVVVVVIVATIQAGWSLIAVALVVSACDVLLWLLARALVRPGAG